jgi:hypothetical protein
LDTLEDKKGELTMPGLLERWRRRDGAATREVGEELSKAFVTSPQAFMKTFATDPEAFSAWVDGLEQNTFTIYQALSELDGDLWTAYYEKLKSLMLDAAQKLDDCEFAAQAQQIASSLAAIKVRRIW